MLLTNRIIYSILCLNKNGNVSIIYGKAQYDNLAECSFSAVKWLRRHVAGSGVDIKTTGFVWGE